LAKDYVTPVVGVVLIGFSLYMFYSGIGLMVVRDVASSLLAILIGFVTLSGGITLLRTWAIARVYEGGAKVETESREESSRGGKESS